MTEATHTELLLIVDRITGEQKAMSRDNCSCGRAAEMVALGLWKPEFAFKSPYYVNTPLGEQVRQHLLSNQEQGK